MTQVKTPRIAVIHEWRTFFIRLGLDVLLWTSLPAAFLFFCVSHHLLPKEAIVPHLRLVGLALLGLFAVRIALASVISRPLAQIAVSLLGSTLLAIAMAYYAIVVIGLQSWGRVISWELLASYSGQALELAEVLGISVPIALATLAGTCLTLFAAAWLYLKYVDWTPIVRHNVSKPLRVLVVAAATLVCAIESFKFAAAPPTAQSEPVALTLFPKEAALDIDGYRLDRLSAAKLDAIEDRARLTYQPAKQPERSNLVLIVVDALRPDHMGVYGYPRRTTPNLSSLERAGQARVIESVRATCASSACGLLSIAASKFVHQFSYRPITLYEVLKRHGYRVHLILSGDHTWFYGLKKLYGPVDTYFDANGLSKVQYLNDDQLVIDRLAGFPYWDGVPVMMQFHLMSTHILGKRRKTADLYLPAANYANIANRDAGAQGANERAINYYDNGVVQADAVIGELLATLRSKGYLDNAIVAITADHGELLGEHGFFAHGNTVREEALRVPLVLVWYGKRPAPSIERRRPASQVDIAPTLLAELRIPAPPTWSGTALQEPAVREFTYFQEGPEVGLFDQRDPGNEWKYWVNVRTGKEYAFNVSVDARETKNAIDSVSADQRREWRLRVMPGASLFFERRDHTE